MRASELIEKLEELIEKHGDKYVICRDNEEEMGAFQVKDITIVNYKETKYFLLD